MKKFKLFLLLLLVTIIPVSVLAVEETKVEDLEDLKLCVEKSGICKLGANVVLDSVLEVGEDVTIDLNDYSITPKVSGYEDDSVITVLRGGKLTVKDSGTNGLIDAGKVAVGIKITKKGEAAEGEVATLIVDGGTIKGSSFAISGNGLRHNTAITINGGNLEGATVIYHPQKGTLVLNGGTLIGSETGIELRSGSLTVNGGTIIGNGNPFEQEKNGSGTTTIGAGVAVVQHTTELVAGATINGGTIKGYRSIVQNNVQENKEEAVAKVSLTINNGNFEVINNGDSVVLSENLTKFISGGTYSAGFDAKYLKDDNYMLKKIGEDYVVGLAHAVTLSEVKNGTANVSEKDDLVAGETVTITTTPSEGYELSLVKVVTADNKVVEVKDGKFVMPDSNVTVTVEFSKIAHTAYAPTVVVPKEEIEEPVIGVEKTDGIEEILLDSLMEYDIVEDLDNSVTVKLEVNTMEEEAIDEKVVEKMEEAAGKAKIATYFDITVAVRNSLDNSLVDTLPELTKEIELMILLPENLKNTDKDVERVYYVVRRHVDKDNKETFESLEAKLSEDGNYLIFKTDKFSTYALAYEDVKVEEVLPPKTFDGISTYFVIGALSLLAFAGISIFAKKKMFN